MAGNFDKFAQEGNHLINELCIEIGTENREKAGRVLSAVLHVIRDRLVPEEAIHFMSQLPMAIKAVFVNGWKISDTPKDIESYKDFLHHLRMEHQRIGGADFVDDQEARRNIHGVFNVLSRYVSSGQLRHLRSQLPKEVQQVLFEGDGTGR